MCTAICYQGKNTYFGRTLDLEYHYEEEVVFTPRHFPLPWQNQHLAYLGMATMCGDVPLYYDGVNEQGVAISALRFTDFAHYEKEGNHPRPLRVYEVIPYILSQATSARHAIDLLLNVTLVDTPISPAFPTTPLHFLISDESHTYTVEPLIQGLSVTPNPLGVLTNAPDFQTQLLHYQDFYTLAPQQKSRAAHTLPGNWTSKSRFVRAAYLNKHLEKGDHRHFFHMMSSLAVPPGAAITDDGRVTRTIYTSCMNLTTCTYHFTTFENPAIRSVPLFSFDLDSATLIKHSL